MQRVVQQTVGNDPKYTAWYTEVAGANSNSLKMITMCGSLPIEMRP